MNSYASQAPRLVIGLAAAALTLATIGVAVVAPAHMNFRSDQVPVLAVSTQPAQVTRDAAGQNLVYSIDVSAVREAHLVTVIEPLRATQRRG
ncbi:MAG: hypothetical protein ACHP91_09625 [Burkholderiales bacterium]|jgi:hypothetical protein